MKRRQFLKSLGIGFTLLSAPELALAVKKGVEPNAEFIKGHLEFAKKYGSYGPLTGMYQPIKPGIYITNHDENGKLVGPTEYIPFCDPQPKWEETKRRQL